jgi:hypothetical protein
MTKEHFKHYLRHSGLAYMTAEALYENALYAPLVWRHALSTVVLALRTGVFGSPPGQPVITWDVPFPQVDRPADLIAWLRLQGVAVCEGGHTFYVAPQPVLRRIIPSIVDFYPERAGFKILKDLRDPLRARYIYKHPRSLRMLKTVIGAPRDQLVAANYMYALGIGPRVWDVCCWKAPGKQCTVFVVDHVSGRPPSLEQCVAFLAHLEDLNARSHLRILVPRWRETVDFQPPQCNRNLVYADALGRVQYVDFQNFGLKDRGFGWREAVSPAKREKRSPSVAAALRDAGIELRGRLVLDTACADGARLHAALAAGAAWGIGWDRAETVALAGDRLLSHGSARFNLIAADLHQQYPLQDDIPRRLQHLLPGAVVFCSAGGGHVAAPETLFALPWSVLVCEGDGSDTPDEIVRRLHAMADSSGTGGLEVVSSGAATAARARRPFIVLRRPGGAEALRACLERAG